MTTQVYGHCEKDHDGALGFLLVCGDVETNPGPLQPLGREVKIMSQRHIDQWNDLDFMISILHGKI
ncbi:Hypothetical predicted protein [Mytilus galloprovincialis]|uniref:Uncharacterized protein n=1 Tax=Mytilus galloprovincialis TaxID=29158 RepID=A0A8B6D4M2_MYTGA|nr:Hypothetical predicted protein [Mytilus galloprovincialis]